MKHLKMIEIPNDNQNSSYININQIVYFDDEQLLLDDGTTFKTGEQVFKKLVKATKVVAKINVSLEDLD